MSAPTAGRFVGQRIPRREDARLLTGRGQYVDDLAFPGALHVAFARSNVARGTIVSLDVSAARALPGVTAVFTADEINQLVLDSWVDFEGPEGGGARPFRVMAQGDVRFAGEALAMVLAESRYVAEDAVELIDVEVEALPAMVDMEQALAPGAPLVHPERPSNLAGALPDADLSAVDAAMASAAHVITRTFRQHRYACVPMETRGIVASWDRFREEMTIWVSTQGPHGVKTLLTRALGLADRQMRVIMPDVGGAFGQKMFPVPEEFAVAAAARLLGRTVKWIEDRRENLLSGQHAREDRVTVTFGVDGDGRVLAAKADFLENVGAFPAAGSSSIGFSAMLFPGPYRIPVYGATGRAVYTNTGGRCSYRGPWMIETVAREQMMDHVATVLGMDPLELRRRNVVRTSELPYTTAVGLVYDQMTADQTLEQAASMVAYDELRSAGPGSGPEGRRRGVGISLFAEPSGIAAGTLSSEAATVRIGPNGQVDVITTSASHGQSTETTIAQVVADELGLDIEDISVVQGDTAATPYGPGTGGSRSAVLVSGAVRGAASQVRAQLLSIAAHRLEAAPEDLRIEGGVVSVAGTPSAGISVRDVARAAYGDTSLLPPGQGAGLEGHSRYSPSSPFTWSNACHICVADVDPITGHVDIARYVVSEDCGVMINPNVVEGQIAGGVVQGIGGVLYEHLAYDRAGNPLATTFVDYLLPTTTEVPTIEYGHIETPAPTNAGGHKGLGEGGAIGSPPAVINAVADALAPLGVSVTEQPLGPADVVRMIESALSATR